MSADVQIRPMEAGDLDSAVALAGQLAHAPQWPRAAYQRAIDPTSTPRRVCLVAGTGEVRVAGFVIASVVGAQAEIESIAVAPGVQRRGIGRALMEALIAELRGLGVAEVLLEVRESNRSAAALYGKAGFVQSGRRAGYYRDPEEDAVLYCRSLEMPARL